MENPLGLQSSPRAVVGIIIGLLAVVAIAAGVGQHVSSGTHGLTVNAPSAPNNLGSGTVNSCVVKGSSVSVSGQLQHGRGDAAVIGFVTVEIVDGLGTVLGGVSDHYVGPPFTRGSLDWAFEVSYSGQPSACKVSANVALPPNSLLLP